MNRDFEIKQLLRAYHGGIMTEAAFEEEMARLEREALCPNGNDRREFEAFGQIYRCEREAIIAFFDKLHIAQMDAAIGFAGWAMVCRTPGLRTGLLMIAERAAYHTRVLERRARELGGELHAGPTVDGAKLAELLANREISDPEKLNALASFIQDPNRAMEAIFNFAALIEVDIESKQALRLLGEDELSSATWLQAAYISLTGAQTAGAPVERDTAATN